MSPASQKALIVFALLIAVYALVKFGPPYYRNYQVQSMTEKAAALKADPLRARLADDYVKEQIKTAPLPITQREVVMRVEGSQVRVWVDWRSVVELIPDNPLLPRWVVVLDFHDEGSAPLKK